MAKSLPPDNLYNGLSLDYDLGYGAEGEYNTVRNILRKEGYPTTDSSISEALSVSNAIYRNSQKKLLKRD